MNRVIRSLFSVLLVAVSSTVFLQAQNDFERLNTNLGASMTLPLNPTAKYADLGWGVVGGAGYNFSKHHSVVGEFMWNWLFASDFSTAPVNSAAQASIDGNTYVYAVTGNYRFDVSGKRYGTYLIGGGGWYYRYNSLSDHVTVAAGTPCVQPLTWWGARCQSGIVVADQTLKSAGSSSLGWNAGAGFTFKTAEPSYRFYVEGRYHFAPSDNINTQFVNVTIGVRY